MSLERPLTLLYDGSCPVCSLEMDHLRMRSRDGKLRFVDIAAPGFDAAAFHCTLEALHAEIHGVWPDGTHVRGVPVLRLAYEAAGLGWVMRPTTWPVLRPLADAGYRIFARHRTAISRVAGPVINAIRAQRARAVAKRMAQCANGACRAGEAARPRSES